MQLKMKAKDLKFGDIFEDMSKERWRYYNRYKSPEHKKTYILVFRNDCICEYLKGQGAHKFLDTIMFREPKDSTMTEHFFENNLFWKKLL